MFNRLSQSLQISKTLLIALLIATGAIIIRFIRKAMFKVPQLNTAPIDATGNKIDLTKLATNIADAFWSGIFTENTDKAVTNIMLCPDQYMPTLNMLYTKIAGEYPTYAVMWTSSSDLPTDCKKYLSSSQMNIVQSKLNKC